MLIDKIIIERKDIKSYPYNLPLFRKNIDINTASAVTILLGNNGSGKSSLMKVIQSRLKLVEINYPKKEKPIKLISSNIKLMPSLGKLKGFFFESLSFIHYMDYMQKEIREAEEEIERIDQTYKGHSDYAKMMAKSPHAKTIYELKNMYQRDLTQISHGEAYLDFFSSRIKDKQIYLLDEPETPLSVQNQLTLMVMIMDAVKRGCQFIIATHSPILTAFPKANIYEIKDEQLIKTSYDDVESIQTLKQFLNQKEQFIKHLYTE